MDVESTYLSCKTNTQEIGLEDCYPQYLTPLSRRQEKLPWQRQISRFTERTGALIVA
jgi:hypothetical protein